MAAGLAVDYIEFLNEKFMLEFKEAEEEFGVELPLLLHFREIEKVLEEKSISPSTPIAMRNWLYTLKFALADCIILAEKERERKAQNKKSQLDRLSVKKLWFFCKTGRKLVQIRRKLKKMQDVDSEAEGCLVTGPVTVCSVWNPSWVRGKIAFQIYGFDEQLLNIKSSLLKQPNPSDHIKTVGIVGMRGVGKTTLAYFFVNYEAWKVFSPIIWVTLSEKRMNPSEIVRRLLKTLRYHYNDNNAQAVNDDEDDDYLSVQLRELHDRLSGKKYLIVLDNVWHVSEWYSDLGSDHPICFRYLSHSLPKGCGGAVIVTGSEDVVISMVGEQNLLRLEPTLDEETLWSIFMDSVERKTFLTSDHHLIISRMKQDIIDRCDGLPFAAKSLAEIISLKLAKKQYWTDSWKRKKFSLRSNQPFDKDITELVERLPGVDKVFHRFDEVTVVGKCDPEAIARELGKFWIVELTSVCQDQHRLIQELEKDEWV